MSKDFAALLRQSRFASWDPAVEQVYTSPINGGYRLRMDYGLKRSLPRITKRFPSLRIQSIDTAEKYTEFDRAPKAAAWLQRFESARIGGPTGSLSTQNDTVNYPMAKVSGEEFIRLWTDQQQLPPNFLAMSDREFSSFVEGLRGASGAWAKFLEARQWVLKEVVGSKNTRTTAEAQLMKSIQDVKEQLEGDKAVDWTLSSLQPVLDLESQKGANRNEAERITEEQIKLTREILQNEIYQLESRLAALSSTPFEKPSFPPSKPMDLFNEAQVHVSLDKAKVDSTSRLQLLAEFFTFLSHLQPSSSPQFLSSADCDVNFEVPPIDTAFLGSKTKGQPAITYHPHPSLGLSFLPANAFHRRHLAPSLPARLLGDGTIDAKDGNYYSPEEFFRQRNQSRYRNVSVMGQIGRIIGGETNNVAIRKTQFYESEDDGKNMDRGRLRLRVGAISVWETDATPSVTSANLHGAGLGGELGDKWTDGWRSRKSLLEEKPNVELKLSVEKSEDGLGQKFKLGGLEWVSQMEESGPADLDVTVTRTLTKTTKKPSYNKEAERSQSSAELASTLTNLLRLSTNLSNEKV